MRRAPLASCLALVLALAWAGTASAHAILVSSDPKEAAEVAGPDVEIHLEFNSRIDASRSSLLLSHDGAEAKPLPIGESPAPNKLTAKAASLAPGAYRLRWQVLSVDGHVSRGDVNFKVRAP
jgi:methionine-rich copper-binding protein CopC